MADFVPVQMPAYQRLKMQRDLAGGESPFGPSSKASGIRKKIEGAKAVAGGAVSQTLNLVSQFQTRMADIDSPSKFTRADEFFSRLGVSQGKLAQVRAKQMESFIQKSEAGKQTKAQQEAFIQKLFSQAADKGVDTDSLSYNIAFGIGESLPMLPVFGATNKLATPVAQRILGKYAANPILLQGVAGALSSPLDTATYTSATEGRAPRLGEYAAGLALDSVFSALIPGVQISTGAAAVKARPAVNAGLEVAATQAKAFDQKYFNGSVQDGIKANLEAVEAQRVKGAPWHKQKALSGKAVGLYDWARTQLIDPTSKIFSELKKAGASEKALEELEFFRNRMNSYADLGQMMYTEDGIANSAADLINLKALDDPLAIFSQYVYAKAINQELAINPDLKIKGDAPMADAKWRNDLIAQYEPVFETHAQTIYKGMSNLIDRRVEAGIITKAEGEVLKSTRPEYIPLRAIKDDLPYVPQAVISGQSTGLKKMGDSINVTRLEDANAAILNEYLMTSARIEQTKFKQKLVDSLDSVGAELKKIRTAENVLKRQELGGRLNKLTTTKADKEISVKRNQLRTLIGQMKEQAAATKKGRKVLEEYKANASLEEQAKLLAKGAKKTEVDAAKKLIEGISKAQAEIKKIKAKRQALGAEMELYADKPRGQKRQLTLRRNGIDEVYQVPDYVYRYTGTVDTFFKNKYLQALNEVTRVMKTGNTGANIAKMPKFLVWDMGTAVSHMEPAVRKEFFSSMDKVLDAAFSVYNKGDLYKEAIEYGGLVYQSQVNRRRVARSVLDVAAEKDLKTKVASAKQALKANKKAAPLTALRGTIKVLEKLTDYPETVMRLHIFQSAFQAYRMQGMSVKRARIKAGLEARNILPDYANVANVTRYFETISPYVSSGVAGLRSFARAVKRDPKGTIARYTIQYSIPAFGIYAATFASDKKRQVYEDLREYEFDNSLVMITDGAYKDSEGMWQGVYKIPIPPEASMFVNPVRRILASANAVDPLSFKGLVKDMGHSLLPMQVGPQGLVPMPATPALEAWTNQRLFSQTPITWDYESERDASQVAKFIHKVVNSDDSPGFSPKDADHLIRGYFGGIGMHGVHLVDQILFALGAIGRDDIANRGVIEDTLRPFYGAAGGQKVTERYDAKGEAKRAKEKAAFGGS